MTPRVILIIAVIVIVMVIGMVMVVKKSVKPRDIDAPPSAGQKR